MTVHPAHVALIDTTGQIPVGELAQYAAALNEQVMADFGPVWGAHAIVSVASEKPAHSWALKIQTSLNQPGALGYHTDALNQPEALVELTSDVSVTLSHELMEMLADPWGNRMRSAPLPHGLDPSQVGLQAGAWVSYLLEVADPPEAISYPVLKVPVSDFILPPWYRTGVGPYSHAGGCTAAQQVADGGYCSFARTDGEWFQVFNEGGTLTVSNLGKFNAGESRSIREWADQHAREHRASNG